MLHSRMQHRDISPYCERVRAIEQNVSEVFVGKQLFVGKQRQVRHMLIGFIAGLHVPDRGCPRSPARPRWHAAWRRAPAPTTDEYNSPPTCCPGDIVGMTVWNNETRQFDFKQGAIMHQFILADEINRASPRTQSSLLEAMQEGSVTVDGTTYRLPDPFFVIATQNPVTFIGVFHLPEGELDRFGISLSIGYPHSDDEVRILDHYGSDPLHDTAAGGAAAGRDRPAQRGTLGHRIGRCAPLHHRGRQPDADQPAAAPRHQPARLAAHHDGGTGRSADHRARLRDAGRRDGGGRHRADPPRRPVGRGAHGEPVAPIRSWSAFCSRCRFLPDWHDCLPGRHVRPRGRRGGTVGAAVRGPRSRSR